MSALARSFPARAAASGLRMADLNFVMLVMAVCIASFLVVVSPFGDHGSYAYSLAGTEDDIYVIEHIPFHIRSTCSTCSRVCGLGCHPFRCMALEALCSEMPLSPVHRNVCYHDEVYYHHLSWDRNAEWAFIHQFLGVDNL
eukprot:6160360-Amphidinium_carterae.1